MLGMDFLPTPTEDQGASALSILMQLLRTIHRGSPVNSAQDGLF